jgi:hypothetical protein
MRLLDLVAHVRTLTGDAPYAIIGGLAQILWARKTHTDDLGVALAASDLVGAREKVTRGSAGPDWTLPTPPDVAHESNDVFQVCHVLYQGAVIDLSAFANTHFNDAIVSTSVAVSELRGIRFVRPELLLITHLLRPGPTGALAAVELVIARTTSGVFDTEEAHRWAAIVDRSERLEHVLKQADALRLV